ncbi:MAG: hypothetical protein APF76_15885 [Desulfitibacter sp. BRH_c19]|nr:MAG: hypothetical protein APF76_15885 [Desulfitibacter sp. BRH_c19]
MTVRQVNPLNDFIFKKLLGEEDSKDNLIAFLNAVLDPVDRKKLVSLEIVDNKELTKELVEDKTGRLDVRAKTADGKNFTHKDLENNPLHRWLYFFDKSITDETRKEIADMDDAIKKTNKKLER